MNLDALPLTLPRMLPRTDARINLNECPCNWTYQVTSGPVRGTLTEVDSLSTRFMIVRRAMGATW